MTETPKFQQKIDNSIIPSLKAGKAILVLGEGIFAAEGKTLSQQLFEFLAEHGQTPTFVQEEGLFSLRPENDRLEVEGLVKTFFQNQVAKQQPLFDQLAALPFHLVLSMNPDNGMELAYKRQQKEAEKACYHKKEPKEIACAPAVNAPMLFNLMGELEEAESLVFTVSDLFEYMLALGKNEIPSQVRHQIKKANNFIFLGFQFERWYTKLLVRLLGLHQGYFLQSSTAVSPYTKLFCAEQLRINIIEGELPAFVKALSEACKKEGLLQQTDEGETLSPNRKLAKQLEKQMAAGEVSEVLELLMEFWEEKDDEQYNMAVATSGALRSLDKKLKAGTIDSRDEQLERNKRHETILFLIKSMKEL